MVNNQGGRPGDEPDRQTRGIPETGSDVEEVRNEVPAAGQPTNHPSQTPDQPRTIGRPEQPETHDTPDTSTRPPGLGPDKNVEFDRNPVMQDNDDARPAKAGLIGTGMNFTVVIILVVAVIVILWFLL